jgi:hypothetical protein
MDGPDKGKKEYWIMLGDKSMPGENFSFAIGSYTFLVNMDSLYRYKLHESTIDVFAAHIQNIRSYLDSSCPRQIESRSEARGIIEARLLDEDLFNCLSRMPDTDDYWTLTVKYKKAAE